MNGLWRIGKKRKWLCVVASLMLGAAVVPQAPAKANTLGALFGHDKTPGPETEIAPDAAKMPAADAAAMAKSGELKVPGLVLNNDAKPVEAPTSAQAAAPASLDAAKAASDASPANMGAAMTRAGTNKGAAMPAAPAQQAAMPATAPSMAPAPVDPVSMPKSAEAKTESAGSGEAPAPGTVAVDITAAGAPKADGDKTADYYEERAKSLLASEKRTDGILSPLQKAAPDYNVIVCEAGCGNSGPRVVYKEPKYPLRSVATDAKQMATSVVTKAADCKGGCSYAAGGIVRAASVEQQSKGPAFGSGQWLTTVKPEAGKIAVRKVPAAAKSASNKALREDWMVRINREREAEKAAGSDTAAPAKPAEEPTTDPRS